MIYRTEDEAINAELAAESNPWTMEMLANDYHLGRSDEEAKIIRENAGHDVLECGKCTGKAHYKNTIGTHKCWSCGALYFARTQTWG